MANFKQSTYRRVSTIGLLAAVPYLLLSASQSVKLKTVVSWEGSGLREYVVSYQDGRLKEVNERLRERTPGRARQARPRRDGPMWMIARSWREANAGHLGNPGETALDMTGIIQNPLSPWTEYRWVDNVTIYRETATDVETFGAVKAALAYQLQMPGRIVRATGGGQIRGNTVTWELSAEQDEHVLEASSRRLRGGYLLLVIYILGFIAFQITRYAAQAVRNRPRKI